MTTPVILLASGGLDSTTVAYWLAKNDRPFYPLFFDYGQHCSQKEWETLQLVLPGDDCVLDTIRVDLSDIYRSSNSLLVREANPWEDTVKDEDLYIPYRTMLFFTASACIAQSRGLVTVLSGFINSNHAKEIDCSAEFLNNLDALASNVGPVRFELPFRDWSKADVVRLASELGVPIGQTYSCQLFSDLPCGACPNCVERLNALKEVDV